MEFCPTLDVIGDYFTKSLQVSQFRRFHNIVIGIHEDDIPSYNAPRRALLEEQKLKLKIEKEEARRLPKSQATRATKDCIEKSL